ncbi:redox-sensitive transcriptional activator SoxR [Celeribacter neptunius]|uniref:MerR family transcriptional regulator, redox-sensitive transcriptional activator SoxR n=1 Tax=Celeribacter neptunius TaxID=588602 RepID=A0A1I3S3Y0_9RHOB|nr:redox-sensitive transcriptional activator SoxR [Celeribacter neptunius]SFJ52206.1 MerR family transcriptional regulator, redox-sensitive transcriptional activator SoxR [Celeribacter neptunius]
MPAHELTIGQVASRTGLSVSAIRYYEKEGLVFAHRNAGGQRRFPRSALRRLSFVIAAQKFGFTIARIRDVLSELPEDEAPSAKAWHAVALEFRADLDRKIAALEALRDNLEGCIGCGCLSMKNCKIYNRDDEAAREGPGPRVLRGI